MDRRKLYESLLGILLIILAFFGGMIAGMFFVVNLKKNLHQTHV